VRLLLLVMLGICSLLVLAACSMEEEKALPAAALRAQAVDNNDPAFCQKINDASLRSKCLDAVAVAFAVQKSDVSLCAKVTDEARRQECSDIVNYDRAMTEGNAQHCTQNIMDPDLSKNCLEELRRKELANADDEIDCVVLSDEFQRSVCEDNLRIRKAFEANDPSLCLSITTRALREACEEKLG